MTTFDKLLKLFNEQSEWRIVVFLSLVTVGLGLSMVVKEMRKKGREVHTIHLIFMLVGFVGMICWLLSIAMNI